MRKSKEREHLEYYARVHTDCNDLCPLCGRVIPDSQKDEHHLVPKSRQGKITTTLHRACHRQIHMLFTITELETCYNSPEALLEHPDMQKFVAWISKKPNDFLPQFRPSDRKKDTKILEQR